VLFSGTPCQIAGLKAFLRKDYDNLLSVDFVCHGTPSPAVWQKYLEEIMVKYPCMIGGGGIGRIGFRDKIWGWKILTFAISYEVTEISRFDEDPVRVKFVESSDRTPFMKGFLQNLYLRPSCYNCPAKSLSSGSDITIGDYWGILNFLPDFDDDKGVSLVMVNSQKGREIYEILTKEDIQTTYLDAFAGNQVIEKSVVMPVERNIFFSRWQHESLFKLISRLTAFSLLECMKNKLSVIATVFIKRMGIFPLAKYLKRK
jgi:coenzyme F420-reducing hydrogenase beta subunit